VTHKGAAADSGHYIGFVKRSVFHPNTSDVDDDEDWYKFDDDKVSIFPKAKLATLDGGGALSVLPFFDPFVYAAAQGRIRPLMFCCTRQSR
jgi:hypothetical protein